jgi:hypothetical protein
LAIGEPFDLNTNSGKSGNIYIYKKISDAWVQFGDTIVGENIDDKSGYSVSLNAAGDRIAIGAPYNDDNGTVSGHVRIYDWNKSLLKWKQLGQDIVGENSNDRSGWSVSLNYEGDRVGIGSPFNDGRGEDAGHTRIYEFNKDTSRWSKVGDDINGVNPGDNSGWSVSLDASGNRIAIGSPYNIGNSKKNSGIVRIYTWVSRLRSWIPITGFVDGENAEDLNGFSVSLNAPGDAVAMGAIHRQIFDTGYVRMYQVDTKENYNRFTTSTTPEPGKPTTKKPDLVYIPPVTSKPIIVPPQAARFTTKKVPAPFREIIKTPISNSLTEDVIDVIATTVVNTTITTTTNIPITTTTKMPAIDCESNCNKLKY